MDSQHICEGLRKNLGKCQKIMPSNTIKNIQQFCCLLVIIKLQLSLQIVTNGTIKNKSINEHNFSNSKNNFVNNENSSNQNALTNNIYEKQTFNQGYPRQMLVGKSRNSYKTDPNTNKMDRTIIGAIIIGCIFLFITLSITITIIIFCLKKNTVFVFQKSEQEDIHDCTYEDCLDSISYQSSLHCDDPRLSNCHSVSNVRRNHKNQKNFCEYFNKCPVELFYPMHYDRPYPIQFTHARKPSHKRCQCILANQKSGNCMSTTANLKSIEPENEQLPWNKLHEGSVYKPLFIRSSLPNQFTNNTTDIKIKIDLVSDSRQVTANTNQTNDKSSTDDGPLLQGFIENMNLTNEKESSTKIILTPLGKSQTYTELKPLQNLNDSTTDDCRIENSTKRLPKSQSNYDSSIKTKRTL